ncbi:Calpain-9 [Varanus komodoensis]|nr:Calpain-9 [Varanus komodoensis]
MGSTHFWKEAGFIQYKVVLSSFHNFLKPTLLRKVIYKSIFLHFDSDQSGTMSSYELRLALKAAGFQLNNYLLQLIVLRYSDDQYQIEFDDFLNSLIRLENASRVFQALNAKNRDFINLNISESEWQDAFLSDQKKMSEVFCLAKELRSTLGEISAA